MNGRVNSSYMKNNTLVHYRDSNGLMKAETACARHIAHLLSNLGVTEGTKQVSHIPCDACEFDANANAIEQRMVDAGHIARAMKDVPDERRMDAVAVAVDAFCQSGGHLCVDIDYPPGPAARPRRKAVR